MDARTRELIAEIIAPICDIENFEVIIVEQDHELLTVRSGQVMTVRQDNCLNLILNEHPDSHWNMSEGRVVIHIDAGHFIITSTGEATFVSPDGAAMSVLFGI